MDKEFQKVERCLITEAMPACYMVRHKSGEFVMIGKNRGRFSKIASLKNSLKRRISRMLSSGYLRMKHRGELGDDVDPWKLGNKNADEVIQDLFDNNILSIEKVL